MTCTSCGRAHGPAARFCGGCGRPLAARCLNCGAESPPDAQFCETCGAAIAAASAPAARAEARKVVTIVFADLIGSVSLQERLDAEAGRRVMERYHRAMTAAVEVHGGTVAQLLGDGVLAAFGVPRVAEDDALRAVRAGVAMQRAFRELVREVGAPLEGIGLRVAVHTGEVVVGDDETALIGDPTNVAARLQHEARDGDVLLGEATQRLVGHLVTLAPAGTFALKGRSETVAAYRVVSLDRPAGARTTTFVGRDEELRRLFAVYSVTVGIPGARLAVLLGSPGLGKSRLVAEFTQRASDRATVLTARCDAAGGATFAPLAEALRTFLRIEEGAGGDALRAAIDAVIPGDERTRIAAGIGALFSGAPSSPEETFFAVRRLLAGLAALRPVVLVIDDLHWAEPLLFDLIEHLVQWSPGVPLFVLATGRPELREARSSLATPGPLVAEVVTLGGLDAGAATRLAAGVVGATELPAALVGRVLATSEGNPLFLGELVRMLVADGTLVRDGDRWMTTVEVSTLDMPPTIQVLLAARIERLRPEERVVLERAAVIGRQFSRAAVAHLLGPMPDLDARLEALRRSELLEPDGGWFLGEPALRFHHVLIRDAAYRRVLKETRAELHERLADWITGRANDTVEHDETIGFHFEQAHQNRRALGPLDAPGHALGERAAEHLGAAGRRALARDELVPAASLLGRALDLLGDDAPARADLVLDRCEALLGAGDVAPAAKAIDELARLTTSTRTTDERSSRLRAWHTCFTGQLAVLTDPQALRASEGAVAAAAAALAAAGDVAGEAKAHAVHAQVLAQLGKIGACEAALDQALAAARRANERRRANAVLAGAPVAALWGPSPVTRASGRCLDVVRVLRITQGAPAVEAVALRCQAVLETLRGRGAAARRMIASARSLVEELGIAQQLLEVDVFAGLIELFEGDVLAAERWLRPAWDDLRAHGLGSNAAEAGALLARALLMQGRIDEAEAVSRESESLAGESFQAAIDWRGVRAEVLAARGDHGAAVELARAAVEIAAATDDLLDHATARVSLAIALRAAGRGADADAEERRAIELWEAKGASLLIERARSKSAEDRRAARESVAPVAAAPAPRRRVPRNHATLHLERIDEAVAARDVEAVRRLLGDAQTLDHTSGRSYGPDTALETFRWMIERSAGLAYRNEPIAALGPWLALARWRESSSGVVGDDLPVGPFEVGGMVLVEVDAEARSTSVEIFAGDKLGDAVARLYERHAELLPEGPTRRRAAAIARSVAAMMGRLNRDRMASAIAPSIEIVDHRVLGTWSARGADDALRHVDSWLAVGAGHYARENDVLALQPDALLLRRTFAGTDRTGGGAFDGELSVLWRFGDDGRLIRWEMFDPDRAAEVLARFDELLGKREAVSPGSPRGHRVSGDSQAEPPHPILGRDEEPRRRVRANAASALVSRFEAAFARGDDGAHAATWSDDIVVLDHPTGSSYGYEAHVRSFRQLARSREPNLRLDVLATLGDALVLCRSTLGARGRASGNFDVAEWEREETVVFELGEAGRCRRIEIFAGERLGDAVGRLYERHAALLPDGRERARAAAIARSVATIVHEPPDRAPFAPQAEARDHRTVGFGYARGAEEIVRVIRALRGLSDGVAEHLHDVLDLRSDALLVRWTTSGTVRTSGGTFDQDLCQLLIFGADGLLARWEQFDAAQAAEALARFDALTAARPAPRPVPANAVTGFLERAAAAVRTGDLDRVAALHADGVRAVHHRTGLVLDREALLAWWRLFFRDRDEAFPVEPIAVLGDRLMLYHQRWTGSGSGDQRFDVGPWRHDNVVVAEVDAGGRAVWLEVFAEENLSAAVTRLYERYAERLVGVFDRARAAAIARNIAATAGPLDLDRLAASAAPSIECVDHRLLGTWSYRGLGAVRRHWQAQFDVASIAARDDAVLALEPEALLVRRTWLGTDRRGGGSYENVNLVLFIFGADGRVARGEAFDVDDEVEALARFDDLARNARSDPSSPTSANAASRAAQRLLDAHRALDIERVAEMLAPGFHNIDRRRMLQTDLDREQFIESFRWVFQKVSRFDPATRLLTTRGDRLALFHARWGFTEPGGGPSEIEFLQIWETDASGRIAGGVGFDPDDLDAAYAELEARYAALGRSRHPIPSPRC